MILGFQTNFGGKPTYFIDKIWKGLQPVDISEFIVKLDEQYLSPLWLRHQLKPKIHTIRKDKTHRWKPGMVVDFFINVRTENMFRFAPKTKVISTQRITIRWLHEKQRVCGAAPVIAGRRVSVRIDGRPTGTGMQPYREWLQQLAQNDGFDTVEDFFAYFNEDFEGKIIHWTDFKY